MFVLKKLITQFLLPPGVFIFILLTAAAWLMYRRRRGIAFSCLLFGLTIWAFASNPISERLMLGLEKGLAIPSPLHGDVIILLGGGIHDNVPDLTGRGTPSDDMMGRVITAVRAQRQLKAPIIISGGVVFAGRSAEAPVVRRILIDLGVPANQVLVEQKSRDTVENAKYCKEIMLRHGFRSPLLVTSAYHMRRSIEAFKRAGLSVTPLPAQFLTGSDLPVIWADYLPTAGALHASSRALHEYMGLLFYRLSTYRL
jgi:uncharacterized SAM-binding protein YcdF (DUF218 family)